jgi:hypothetical protein
MQGPAAAPIIVSATRHFENRIHTVLNDRQCILVGGKGLLDGFSRRLWNLSINLWSKAYAVTAKALAMPERDYRIWGGMETHISNLAGIKFWWSETEINFRQRTGYKRKGKSVAESFGRRNLAVRVGPAQQREELTDSSGVWVLLFWRRSWGKDRPTD